MPSQLFGLFWILSQHPNLIHLTFTRHESSSINSFYFFHTCNRPKTPACHIVVNSNITRLVYKLFRQVVLTNTFFMQTLDGFCNIPQSLSLIMSRPDPEVLDLALFQFLHTPGHLRSIVVSIVLLKL